MCRADACAVDDDASSLVSDAGLFRLRRNFDDPIVGRYLTFARRHGIEVAGFEFIETAGGRQVTFDIKTNTNYNPAVDADAARICRDTDEEVVAELSRVLDTRSSREAYASYQDFVADSQLESRVSLEDYSVSNRGLRAGLVGTRPISSSGSTPTRTSGSS